MISYRLVQKKKKATNCTVWSLVPQSVCQLLDPAVDAKVGKGIAVTIFVERASSSTVTDDGRNSKHRHDDVGVRIPPIFRGIRRCCCVVWRSFVCDKTGKRFEITKGVARRRIGAWTEIDDVCVICREGACTRQQVCEMYRESWERERERDRSYSWRA